MNGTKALLDSNIIIFASQIEINLNIATQAIAYRKNKNKKIKLPDAILLATAKYLSADFITDDWDDFKGIDSSLNIIPIDDLKW